MFTTIVAAVVGFFIRKPMLSLIVVGSVVLLIGLAWGGSSVNNWWHKHQQEKVLKLDHDSIQKIQEARDEATKASAVAKKALQDSQAAQKELATLAHEVTDLRARANKMEPLIADLRKRRADIETAFKAQPPPKDLQEALSALEALGYGRK